MDVVKEMLRSKKFLALVVAVIVAIGGRFGLELDLAEVGLIVGAIAAYIVGQGIADNGKEAAKIERGDS